MATLWIDAVGSQFDEYQLQSVNGASTSSFVARLAWLAAGCVSIRAGCSSSDTLGVPSPDEERALIEATQTTSPNLQAGEKIKVTVFGEGQLSGEYQIDPGG